MCWVSAGRKMAFLLESRGTNVDSSKHWISEIDDPDDKNVASVGMYMASRLETRRTNEESSDERVPEIEEEGDKEFIWDVRGV